VEIFDIFGAAFPPPVPIDVKCCTAKRTHVPVGRAKFDLNRSNDLPLRGEKPDFWPVSKFNRQFAASRHPAGKEVDSPPVLKSRSLCKRGCRFLHYRMSLMVA